jgi:hypothetical protein
MTQPKYQIIDNFLSKNYFKKLQEILFSDKINWFYKDYLVEKTNKKEQFFFSHCFYNNNKIQSPLFELLLSQCISLLNPKSLIEIRANLTFKQNKLTRSDYHVDRPFPCKTAILYLNTCNGYTLLKYNKKLKKINSKENRMLIFDSQIEHAAVLQTDSKRRIVINFNYET